MTPTPRLHTLNAQIAKAVSHAVATFAQEVYNGKPWSTADLASRITEANREALRRMNSGEAIDVMAHNQMQLVLPQCHSIVVAASCGLRPGSEPENNR